jgi:cell division protein FtsB
MHHHHAVPGMTYSLAAAVLIALLLWFALHLAH